MPKNPSNTISLYNEAEEKQIACKIQAWAIQRSTVLSIREIYRTQNTWLWFQPSPDEKLKKLKKRDYDENYLIINILNKLRHLL